MKREGREHGLRIGAVVVLTLCVLVALLFAAPDIKKVCAALEGPEFEGWVQDDAFLLTVEEEERLEKDCERISKGHNAGVYIVTTEDFGSGDIKDWQRRIFEEYELGADCGGNGIMLAVSMAERDWGIVSFGSAQDAFTTYGRERMGEIILDDLSDGEFYHAFTTYVSLADDYFTEAEKGKPYTEDHKFGEGWRIPAIIVVSFVLSLAVSFAIVLYWKKSMNTRVTQSGAMAYLKEGSFRLYQEEDKFLYHRVSRTARPKESSSSRGGGMHSDHSGTSGKF